MKDLINKSMKFLSKKVLIWGLGLVSLSSIVVASVVVLFIILLMIIVGGTGNNDSSNGLGGGTYEVSGISEHILKHEPTIRKYAELEGIEQYVPVILSIMQRESGGSPSATDPMQSSESLCGYIGCITNPDHSIQQGVRHFKEVLTLADGDLKLAISSYNFGKAFVNHVKGKNGVYEFNTTIGGKRTYDLALKYSQNLYSKEVSRGRGGMYTCRRQGVDLSSYKACYGDVFYVDDVMSRLTETSSGDIQLASPENASQLRKNIATVGNKWVGKTRYHWGGGRTPASASKGQFDCSSFVYWAYAENGIKLGNQGSVSTETLNKVGKRIPVSQMQVGDLIFWDSYKVDGHVGIYVGNGYWIGSQSSSGVAVVSMNNPYWSKIFKGHVRRVIP